MNKRIFILLTWAVIVFSCQKEINLESSSQDILPVVVTNTVTAISDTIANSGGNVQLDGGTTVSVRGVCWGISANPDITGNHTIDGSGIGVFVSSLTGLSPATTYHVRAYATNSVGTAYGADSSFITSNTTAILPTVTTATVTLITATTASSGGNVLTDGGTSVTARGVCWNTSANPVATDNHTVDGSGIGTFVSNLSSLTPATTYHVRAYATNSTGTVYGGDSTFVTAARDVYVAGFEYTSTSRNAVLWKNGVATILGTSLGIANAVFVSGNDVYVVGSEVSVGPVGFIRYARIWKNGVAIMLGNDFSDANAVFVSGNDVYVAGYESVGTANAATVWKNGVATHLSNGINNAVATDVFVKGPDVYIVGSDGFGSKIWKNGVPTPVNGVDSPNGLYILGSDIYITGHSNDGTTQDIARVWKNTISTALTNGNKYADAKSVFVSGTDIYVTGFESSGPSLNPIVAKLWKNGIAIDLTGLDAEGNAVTVSDADVYVVGGENITSTGIAKLWKNGVASSLTNGIYNAEALSIFVK